jgi:hypothetical protein
MEMQLRAKRKLIEKLDNREKLILRLRSDKNIIENRLRKKSRIK